MELVDFLSFPEPEVAHALLAASLAVARREEAASLSFIFGEETGLAPLAKSHHFFYRASVAQVAAYSLPASPASAILARSSWWFLQSDLLA